MLDFQCIRFILMDKNGVHLDLFQTKFALFTLDSKPNLEFSLHHEIFIRGTITHPTI